MQAGRSRFTLASLPANDFPSVDEVEATERVRVPEAALKELIERTAFAMAQQDVRYYLNGLLFDLRDKSLRCVATDGHRLALCEARAGGAARRPSARSSCRARACRNCSACSKAAIATLELEVGRNHIRVKRDDVTFTSKLIDGRFPDYEAVIPIGADREVQDRPRSAARGPAARGDPVQREVPRRAASKCRPGQLKIIAHNPEQEEAQEEVEAETRVDDLAIGFNVNYLLDALVAPCATSTCVLQLRDANSSALVREAGSEKCRHVVMPLRL